VYKLILVVKSTHSVAATMPSGHGEQLLAKTRLRGAVTAVRLATRPNATSRKKERPQEGASTGNGSRPLNAIVTGERPARRRPHDGGGAERELLNQVRGSISSTTSRRNLMAADDETSSRLRRAGRPGTSSTSGENVVDRQNEDSNLGRLRNSAGSGLSYGYGFGNDDESSRPRTEKSRANPSRQMPQEQYQQQERRQQRRARAVTGQDPHERGPAQPHRRTKTEEKEYSSSLRSRLDQVKQRRVQAQAQSQVEGGPSHGGRTVSRLTDGQARAEAHDQRRTEAKMSTSDSAVHYRGGIGSGGIARSTSSPRHVGSRERAHPERSGSGSHVTGHRPSSGIQGEAVGRTAKTRRQPQRLSSSNSSRNDSDGVPPQHQLAEARKAVSDVDRERKELRQHILQLEQELQALDSLYKENVTYLRKLEDGVSPTEANSPGAKRAPPQGEARSHPSRKGENGSSSNLRSSPTPTEEKTAEPGDRKISWSEDFEKSESSLPPEKRPQSRKSASLTPEQTKALNKAKIQATQTIIKSTLMNENEKRQKIQSANKIVTNDSFDVQEKIRMLKDIAAGKEPGGLPPAPATKASPRPKTTATDQAPGKPDNPAKSASQKAADLTPEQTKTLNKAKMLATQAVIKNASMNEGGKREKIQTINNINSDDCLDVEEKISMLKDIADGKDPVPPAAKAPTQTPVAAKSSKKKTTELTPEQTKALNKAKMLATQAVIKSSSMAEDTKRKKIQMVNRIVSHEYLEVSEKISRLKDVAAGKDVKDPNDDDEDSLEINDLNDNDSLDSCSVSSFEYGGTIVPKEKVKLIRKVNKSLHKSMNRSLTSMSSALSRQKIWMSSFRRLDPRYKILSFFQDVAEKGVDTVISAKSLDDLEQAPAVLQWVNRASAFSVWRPTSRDAIHKMMSGQATGKGLEIKGKSAKCGCLSALVPFIQIYEEQHKERIRECVRDKTMRVFFPAEKARDEAADMLNDVVEMMMFFVQDAIQMLSNPEITEEQEKEVMKHLQWDGSDLGVVKLNSYAPQCYGVEISERLFWEGFVMMQDCSRPPGSKFETGRPSEPAFMDMNFKAVRHVPSEPGEPTPVVYQTDAEYPMSPRTLVVAYEETGRVLPVVSDFDCFTVGTRGVKFDQSLPPDQVDLVKWTVTNIEAVLDQPISKDTWTKRWLEILKQAAIKGFYPKMPRFGFGDPKSYALMGKAVESLQDTGAVRHGAECFNYYFPQDLDDEFLVVSDTLPGGVPWKYVGVEELQEILLQKVDEGFVFPLNPKWVLCDPGWKRIYDKLMKSDKRHVQDALKIWFPPESGIREHIELVCSKHQKGFVREIDESGEVDQFDDMAAAELELERFMALEGGKKKLRAVVQMIALANTLPSAIRKNRQEKLQRGSSYLAPKAPDRQMRRDAAMHRAMQLQEAAAHREF